LVQNQDLGKTAYHFCRKTPGFIRGEYVKNALSQVSIIAEQSFGDYNSNTKNHNFIAHKVRLSGWIATCAGVLFCSI